MSEHPSAPLLFVVDLDRRELLSRHHGTGRHLDVELNRHKAEGRNAAAHNVTHSACPDWVRDFAFSDPEWCERRAAEHERTAAKHRKTADEHARKADEAERRASELRQRHAEHDGEPGAPAPS